MPRRKKSESRQALEFAAILALLGAAAAGLALWRGHGARAAVFAALGLAALGLAAVARPLWLRLFRAWMKLAEGMGWVMTRVLLTVFFFGILTPVGLVLRMFGKSTLDTAWKDGRATYWIDKEPVEAT